MAKGRGSLTMRVNTSGLDSLLADLEAGIDEVVRPAAQAGSQVLYEAAKQNAQRLGKVTGKLNASIYQAYSKDNSGKDRATYHVTWRTKRGADNAAPHAHFIEFGHWRYYQVVRTSRGGWTTAVRPEMQGKPRPKGDRRTNRAGLDAYYVPLPSPVWVPPKPLIRAAYAAKANAAADAMAKVIMDKIDEVAA